MSPYPHIVSDNDFSNRIGLFNDGKAQFDAVVMVNKARARCNEAVLATHELRLDVELAVVCNKRAIANHDGSFMCKAASDVEEDIVLQVAAGAYRHPMRPGHLHTAQPCARTDAHAQHSPVGSANQTSAVYPVMAPKAKEKSLTGSRG